MTHRDGRSWYPGMERRKRRPGKWALRESRRPLIFLVFQVERGSEEPTGSRTRHRSADVLIDRKQSGGRGGCRRRTHRH